MTGSLGGRCLESVGGGLGGYENDGSELRGVDSVSRLVVGNKESCSSSSESNIVSVVGGM